jgi:hypothetical protein
VSEGENSQRRRLSRSLFSQNFYSCNISQTGTDKEDPSGKTVHDMEENNISKYFSNPTIEGGVIAVGFSAINTSSLQPLSQLSLALTSTPREKIE